MPEQTDGKPAAAPDQMTLAFERTYLAHERTLMAWTRTATSLITFGFTLFKFFEFLHAGGQAAHRQHLFGARTFGMIMIGIGVLTLVVACFQHRAQVRRMNAYYPDPPFSLALLLASLIACLGVLGFISGIVNS
jgi:putative membrane protein